MSSKMASQSVCMHLHLVNSINIMSPTVTLPQKHPAVSRQKEANDINTAKKCAYIMHSTVQTSELLSLATTATIFTETKVSWISFSCCHHCFKPDHTDAFDALHILFEIVQICHILGIRLQYLIQNMMQYVNFHAFYGCQVPSRRSPIFLKSLFGGYMDDLVKRFLSTHA